MASTPRENKRLQSRMKPPSPKSIAKAPISEGIITTDKRPKPSTRRHSTGNFGMPQYHLKNIQTDFAVADALQRVGRMVNEDYAGVGEYLASLGEHFQSMEVCQLFMALRQKARDSQPTSLERRVEIWREGEDWCIDDRPGHLIHPSDEIFTTFTDRTPTVIDQDGIKLVFNNMDINNDGCDVKQVHGIGPDRSLAYMPFYYRDRLHASGIVVFEGDLRCRDSGVTGFSKTYWTARLAMEMASQLSFRLTHQFDAITDLGRAQDFEVDIRQGIAESVKRGDELCLLLLDVDNFKLINDSHGYKGGNAVLRNVAEVIKSSVRSDDSATRLGGDEFTVVLRGVSWPEAMNIADRIVKNIKNLEIEHEGTSISGISCSIGGVNIREIVESLGMIGLPATDERIEHIYKRAFASSNSKLLEVKTSGRGRVSA